MKRLFFCLWFLLSLPVFSNDSNYDRLKSFFESSSEETTLDDFPFISEVGFNSDTGFRCVASSKYNDHIKRFYVGLLIFNEPGDGLMLPQRTLYKVISVLDGLRMSLYSDRADKSRIGMAEMVSHYWAYTRNERDEGERGLKAVCRMRSLGMDVTTVYRKMDSFITFHYFYCDEEGYGYCYHR